VTSQTRRIEITAPQRWSPWLCASVCGPGHYVDNRRVTILLGGEGLDGSTTTAQASLSIADVRSLLAVCEWMLEQLKQQEQGAAAEAVPCAGRTRPPALAPHAAIAKTVPWAGRAHPIERARIAKCGKCERPIAFAQDAELELAGWQHPNTFARWICPACKGQP
jgi:hypothetical protein